MASTALLVTSIAASAYGGYTQYRAASEQADAQANAARYQQEVENRNRLAEQQNAQAERSYAAAEQASTASRIKEEQSRANQNLLRAQEQKRKALAAQRAQFVANGVLSTSPSADMIIGELGESLQTRIQDVFTGQADRMAAIQSQGNQRYFSAMQRSYGHTNAATNAGMRGQAASISEQSARRSGSRAGTAALIGGISSIGTSIYRGYDLGIGR